jgi:DNA helicase-2/ATP-dependent DNA helicase PcrA
MKADFSHLNKEQREAIEHEKGPLLLVAGAGTGKTSVLISRMLYLMNEKKINTEEILLLTFTEKAAAEMEERALEALPYGYFDLWISTFHSFCERVLKDHGLEIGLPIDFELLSQTQQWIFIYNNLNKFELDYYRPLGNSTKFIQELIKHFSRLKDEEITPQDYLDHAKSLEENKDNNLSADEAKEQEQEIQRYQELAKAYDKYNQLLLDNSYLDFGDLIRYTLKLFKERPHILAKYQEKFKQVMVDEFQDTNWAQYELIKLLIKSHQNLTVVGDDDQSIYRFRGSSIFNIMQFKDDYPKAKQIVLTKNYRSGQKILDKSYELIKHNNPNRLEEKIKVNKQLKAQKPIEAKVEHWHLQNEESETTFVREKIESIYQANKDSKWSDFAILVRANDAADKFVKELNRHSIPNQFVSLKGLYFKSLILNAIAYFKLLDNYHESSALFRVLNFDYFSIPYKDILELNKLARRKTWSLYEALENVHVLNDLDSESHKKINELLSLIKKHSEMAKHESPSKIFLDYVKTFAITKKLDQDRDKDKFSWLNQFYKKIKEFESADKEAKLKDFVNYLNLELEAGESGSLFLEFEDPEVVKIMTVHSAKGLEFKHVFVCNLVDKRFPTISRTDKISIPEALIKEKIESDKDFHVEEERRLFYVAITRAKENLYLTSAKDYGGKLEKKPSLFLEEMNLSAKEKFSADYKALNELEKDLHKKEAEKLSEVNKSEYTLPSKFSFSQLESYSKCPWQYRYAFILKVPAPEKASLSFGRSLHNTLYQFMYPLLEANQAQTSLFADTEKRKEEIKRQINLDRLMDLYNDYWQGGGYETKKEKQEYYKKGKESLIKFYNDLVENNFIKPIMLEENFVLKIGQDSIKGAIDRVDRLEDGTVEVIDYKTGRVKDKLDTKDKRQLMIYQLALENVLNLKVSKLSYYFLDKEGHKLSFSATDKQLEKLQGQLQEEIDQIKSMDFTPKPSPRTCSYCDFNTICEFRKF